MYSIWGWSVVGIWERTDPASLSDLCSCSNQKGVGRDEVPLITSVYCCNGRGKGEIIERGEYRGSCPSLAE